MQGWSPSAASCESTFSASPTACDPDSTESTPNAGFSDPASENTSVNDRISHDSFPSPRKWDENTVPGWPQLAVLMAKTPDFAAFPRFRDLNIKSLLYYQVQLNLLRTQLLEKEGEDAASDPNGERSGFAERVDYMVEASGEDSEQFKIVERMRKVLKEYNKALLQYSQISALPEPDPYNMLNLRKWMRHEDGGNYLIRGDGEEAWGDYAKSSDVDASSLWSQFWTVIKRLVWLKSPAEDDLDLVVTRPRSKIDGLTKWAIWYLIPFFESVSERRKEKRKPDVEKDAKPNPKSRFWARGRISKVRKRAKGSGAPRLNLARGQVKKSKTVETWSETAVLRMTSGVSTVVACLLPVVAITVLSQLHGTRDLLVCIAGFAVIFAVGLIFLTHGTTTRVEIFTATAAFSAVLVVFISTPVINLPPGTPPP
ncbi:hypothetical protein K505DRAFT_259640 [Melanomma pulvis-pyrius CBS 109.77]|uniref:DUF6594 domain-containing protein n=1 Tax=Melanomma pulvis-pyrius CBS 109.77 TaxID=1314802 RepID=A0A6A6WR40_9PLEO|nr:hypothetical protein K505DRAFT_259640 [Melanomma pulvis-pyrius CBS 109.77]